MIARSSGTSAWASGEDGVPLGVSVANEGSSDWIIHVRGELDLATGPLLKLLLEAHSDSSARNDHPRRIVYLLPDLEFIDASGLTALLTAVDGHGRKTIAIREPSRAVRLLLELAGLGSMIEQP